VSSFRCHICRAVDPCDACEVEGRVYINSQHVITGVIAGCPFKEPEDIKWTIVSDWYLNGIIRMTAVDTLPCAEQKEVAAARDQAARLGVLGVDIRRTGMWQGDECYADFS